MTLSAATRRRFALATVTSLVLGSAGALAVAAPASAATLTVTNTANSGAGSLRDAIATANASVGVADTIVFDGSLSSNTILISSVLIITDSVTISGLGAGSLSIQRTVGPTSDVFAFQPSTTNQDFTLSGITVQGDNVITGSGVVANDNDETPRNVTIVDVTFTDLVNSVIGGPAVNVDTISGTLRIEDSRFYGNSGGSSGGAVLGIDVGSAVVITSSDFNGNDAVGSGGAVYIDSPAATVNITNANFSENLATVSGGGGGVAVNRSAGVTVNGGSFTLNNSVNAGGGIAISRSTFVTVYGTTFDENTVTNNRGGGLYTGFMSGLVTVDSATFTGNFASSAGGGFGTLDDVPVVVTNSRFIDNESGGGGGAIGIGPTAADWSIERSTFQSNTTNDFGGAIYADAINAGGSLTVHSSTFSDNNSDGAGNALALASIDGEATVINSTIDEEAGPTAVIATVFEGELRFRYSTIIGGVFIEQNENTVEIVSSIVDGDTNPAVSVDFGGTPVDVSYSLLSSALDPTSVADGGGNQFSVADFKLGALQNNGGPTLTRLPLTGSPAIDKGLPGGTPPTFDQRYTGFPRVIGGRVDVGAVETNALAATGSTINIWIPIVGGVLLLGGIAAIVVSAVRRRRSS